MAFMAKPWAFVMLWLIRSVSMIAAPHFSHSVATALFPLPMPPVNPTRKIEGLALMGGEDEDIFIELPILEAHFRPESLCF
jgi:hypothetical protein